MAFKHTALTQDSIAKMLDGEMKSNLISQSMLFYGEEYSSKMTAAIELALNLTNNENEFYALNDLNIIILSSRDSSLRIKAAFNLYRTKRTKACKDFLLQQIRIVLLSFHPVLSSSEEVFEKASDVNELLYEIEKLDEENEKTFLSYLDNLEAKLQAVLEKVKKQNSVSIEQIRMIQDWLNETTDSKKVIIIENVELVSEGAKNSLLKLLEEPKDNAYIILISSSIHKILPTLLSRLRKYHFPPIKNENINSFLNKKFFEMNKFNSLKEYFLIKADIDTKKLRSLADSFLTISLSKKKMEPEEFIEMCIFIESFDLYDMFVEYLVEGVATLNKKKMISGKMANKYIRKITSIYNTANIYNQNKRVMTERINLELALEE